MALREMASISRAGYFKAINAAETKDWSSFLLSATPHNLLTAKRSASGHMRPGFPSLPGADTAQQMNEALRGHFFPPKAACSPPPRHRPYVSAPALTKEAVTPALSECSSSLAPGSDGIPYLIWNQGNGINPSIVLQILSPLVSLEYHPASLKETSEVVLDKPGKP